MRRGDRGKCGQLIILFALSDLNRRAKTRNLPLWLINKCFEIIQTFSITYYTLYMVNIILSYTTQQYYAMLLLENNPIFMFAIIQIPDKTIHRRTEDAGDEDDRDERSVFLQIQILVDWLAGWLVGWLVGANMNSEGSFNTAERKSFDRLSAKYQQISEETKPL